MNVYGSSLDHLLSYQGPWLLCQLIQIPPLKYVDFKYKDGRTLANGVLEFPSNDRSQFKMDVVGENGRIRVRVKWGDAYELRYKGSDLKRCLNEESELDELVKRQRYFADPQPSTSFSSDDWSPLVLPTSHVTRVKKPVQLLEVFSIGISSNDLKPPFKLYGRINVQGMQYVHLFNRDQNSPQICFDKIEVKYCGRVGLSAMNDFGIYLDLKDAKGNVFVEGFVSWTFRFFDKWYNKRICSVIRGDHGYVALHYIIIEDGAHAKVNVLVKNNDSALGLLPVKFYGSIVARYSN
ncbi:uncharacterized protein LOC110720096 [Chenopodium quinoa]|uniref:uncharacterized protein LOC110720096 n=1 Tax=Chenopodium quinoa TaxID=63459 RepID=UPI000B791ED0|nr:uncharacterized protein LOC110720096 [Chenopodium quinoa]